MSTVAPSGYTNKIACASHCGLPWP